MRWFNKISKLAGLCLCFGLALSSCQKMKQPALGNYPKDTNAPGGPLKFYVAFDGNGTDGLRNGVDSVRANFPASNSGTSVAGITGNAYKGSATAFVQFGTPNDFAASKSFTIAFWLKKTPQAAGTNFAFSYNSGDYSWTNEKMFFEFEDAGQSTTTAAAGKFYLLDQWFEYTGTKAMANVLNGSWHQLVFVYNQTTSVLSTYIDGVAPTNLPAGFGNVMNGASPRGPLKLYDANDPNDKALSGFTIGGAGTKAYNANTWMGSWDGMLDQFRLYSTALSASEVLALYNSKL